MEALTDALCDELENALDVDKADPDGRLAFNAGSDARLAGLPAWACPYGRTQRTLWRHWLNGWRDVQRGWGLGVRGRWRIQRLPAV